MAQAEIQEVVPVSKDKLWNAIVRYEDYPQFVDGCTGVKVERKAAGHARATYHVSMMKDVTYTLDHKEDKDRGIVEWNLVDSDFFKKNVGRWGAGARIHSEWIGVKDPAGDDSKLRKTGEESLIAVADDLKSKSADLMKKVLTVGVGAVFLTEESLRAMVSEWKLPKEVIGAIRESSRKTKNEFMQSLSQDVFAKIVEKVDPLALLTEFLTRNEVELHVKLGIKPRKDKNSG
jgi:hypothetical protein